MTPEQIREVFARRAVVLDIGGFEPPADPRSSWFGAVRMCAEGEEWPTLDGKAMFPICQVNLTELPFRPPRLDGIEFLTLFVGRYDVPDAGPDGGNWVIRTYRSLSQLVPLHQIPTSCTARPHPVKPRIVEADYPCHEDLDVELPPDVADRYYDLFENAPGFKLGGWPTLVQSEIFWAPLNQHPAEPEYVFQIDSTETGNWMWGDGGVAYFGRGTRAGHRDEWVFTWQCC